MPGQTRPPLGAQIDWGHPLARGLLVAVPGADYETVRGGVSSNTGCTVRGTRGGLGLYSPGGTGPKAEWHRPTLTGLAATEFTLAARVSLTSAPSLANCFTIGANMSTTGTGAGDLRGILLFNGHWYFWGGSADWDSGVNFDTTGTPRDVVFTGDGSDAQPVVRLYLDGQLVATSNGSLTGNLAALGSTNTPYVTFAGRHVSGGDSLTGALHRGAYWNRRLSNEEVAWLAAEPFAFLARQSSKIHYLRVGGTTHNATFTIAGSGALAWTASRTVLATFALAGQGALSFTMLRAALATFTINGAGELAFTGEGGTGGTEEQARFGGAPYSRRDLDRLVADERRALLLEQARREDEELLCLI